MSKIVIMTDSTCNLPAHIIEQEGLIVVPCQVRIGEQTYREGVDLTAEQLFGRMFSSSETPATSLPSGEDYHAAFAEAERRGATQLLGIFLGSSYSGTFNGARLTAQEYTLEVELVDSGTTSLAMGLLVRRAAAMIRAGKSLQDTAAELRILAERAELHALLDTVEYVRRGGRIGRIGEIIANVLNIKPTLRLARNSADVVARNRSHKKGMSALVETARAAAPLQAASVIHTGAEEEAMALAKEIASLVQGDQEILVEPATAALATHAGPNAIGIGFIR
jgi:DegV family protein with EDD domain